MGATAERKRCARRSGVMLGAGLAVLLATGCLDRPLSTMEPATSNVVVKQLALEAPSKIDLLFMIDNSQSMADKQALLADAVPALVRRLVAPRCVDETSGAPLGTNHPCAVGAPEFRPVTDIHVGVLSSSLGGHGSDICTPKWQKWNPTQDQAGHLLAPHLDWSPGDDTADPSAFVQGLAQQVKAAGDEGCGYEASLEAWYRFLIDPEPPLTVTKKDGVTVAEGVDEVLLAQRKEFLRPDSLLLVVMLSDENDCSLVDDGWSWYATQQEQNLYRSTSACASDIASPCCRSCGTSESAPPAGCVALADDPACQSSVLDTAEDSRNLRCWEQKRRFGLDFLYPTRKYAEALTQPTICDSWLGTTTALSLGECNGARVPNPLFAGGRHPGLVFLVGIVGVPWQDLASDATLASPSELSLLSAGELAAKGRWGWLVPECQEPVSPSELPRPMSICKRWNLADQPDDPFMVESPKPRSGNNPATGEAIAGPSAGPMASKINGHEWNTGDGDLQYACIFPLSTPKDCGSSGGGACSCDDVGPGYTEDNPLCQGSSGQYSKLQAFAKAYPGTRHLEVLKDVGDQAVVASICPKDVANPSGSAYGYNAAMDALAARLLPVLK